MNKNVENFDQITVIVESFNFGSNQKISCVT